MAIDPSDFSACIIAYKLDGDTLDASGHGWTSTAVGSPPYVAGVGVGQALSFNGSSQNLVVSADITNFHVGLGDFSVAMWVKPTSFSSEMCLFDSIPPGGSGARVNAFAWVINVTTGKLRFFSNGTYASSTTASVNINSWNHVVLVRTSNIVTYFINGVSDAGGSAAMLANFGITSVGMGVAKVNDAAADFLTGFVDIIRAYPLALTQADVLAIMAFDQAVPSMVQPIQDGLRDETKDGLSD